MFYMPDEKFAFVHIPKTAGRSITAALKKRRFGITHLDRVYGLHPPIGNIRDKYPVEENFAVIRDPRDRLVSIWAHYFSEGVGVKRLNKAYNSSLPIKWQEIQARGFKWWLLEFIAKNPISNVYVTASPVIPQTHWVDDTTKTFKFDELDKVAKHLGKFDVERIGKVGAGNRSHWRDHHDADTLKWIDDNLPGEMDFYENA